MPVLQKTMHIWLVMLAVLFQPRPVSPLNLFRIGSFNMDVFGDTKAGNQNVMNLIVQIIQRYDIIFLQRIKDVDSTAVDKLILDLNNEYNISISGRLGRSSKEQYAFLYRSNAAIKLTGTYQYADTADNFDRPPFAAHFSSAATVVKDFVLLGVRIKPTDAENELQKLPEVRSEVITWAGIDNILILGDLRADCGYLCATKRANLLLSQDGSDWLIADDADTMVSSTDCAYERMIAWGTSLKDGIVDGASDVYKFDQELNLGSVTASHVSKYYPVETALHRDTINIAAFNIQVFGVTKASRPDVMEVISKIVKRYDIVLVQEIRDSSGVAFDTLMTGLQGSEPVNRYSYKKSGRLGRTRSKEEYAYIYRNDIGIKVVAEDQDPDPKDEFEREPFSVRFTYTQRNVMLLDFFLLGIHVKPSEAAKEINLLDNVRSRIESIWNDKSIIMGDLNADCSYVSQRKQNTLDLRTSTDYWPIKDDWDTTVGSSNCAYDRFIVSSAMNSSIVEGSGNIFRFDLEYDLNSSMTKAVSDHYPIEIIIVV